MALNGYTDNCYCRAWTRQAIECYKRGCKCSGCPIKNMLETRCDMKRSVFELVRKYGAPKPKEVKKEKYTEEQKHIIRLVRSGIVTRKELAKELNIGVDILTSKVRPLYRIAEQDGYTFLTLEFMFYEWVDFIRSKDEEI